MPDTVAHTMSGRCVAAAAKVSGSGAPGDDLIIRGAVGRGGANIKADVSKVQAALNNIPPELGGPTTKLVVDGLVGTKTYGAIETLQQRHFGFKDGRVDVLGKTHAKISSLQPLKIKRMQTAQQHLQTALDCMKAAVAKLTAARLALVSSNTLFGGAALKHVDRVFDVTKVADPAGAIDGIIGIYNRMLLVFARTGGLWGWQAFEGEPFTNPDWYGFTYWGGFDRPGQFAGWQRLDTIYFSAFYDKAKDIDRIQTIVHELAHFVGPKAGDQIYDYAYGTTAELAKLPPYQKQHNAESFGNFALQCKFGETVL